VSCDEVSWRQRWWGRERSGDVLSWKKALFKLSRQSEGGSRAMAGATGAGMGRERESQRFTLGKEDLVAIAIAIVRGVGAELGVESRGAVMVMEVEVEIV
jgi:hypothetical protein